MKRKTAKPDEVTPAKVVPRLVSLYLEIEWTPPQTGIEARAKRHFALTIPADADVLQWFHDLGWEIYRRYPFDHDLHE